MLSSVDMRRLLRRGEHLQSRCESQINTARRALIPLEHELQQLDCHEQQLRELLHAHRATEQTFDHGQLLAWLRQQAVIRRQIGTLGIDRVRVEEQRQELVLQIDDTVARRQMLNRKQTMYLNLERRLLYKRRALRSRLEEGELEELLVSRV